MPTGITKSSNQVSILCASNECNIEATVKDIVVSYNKFKNLTSIDENRCIQQYNHDKNQNEMSFQLCDKHSSSAQFLKALRLSKEKEQLSSNS